MTAKKEYWQINTERIADEIRAAASDAHTEEGLKMRVEPILRKSFKDIGIDIDIVGYEKAFSKGPQPGGPGKKAIEKLQNDLNEAVERLWNIKS